jgi:hypothetical protein
MLKANVGSNVAEFRCVREFVRQSFLLNPKRNIIPCPTVGSINVENTLWLLKNSLPKNPQKLKRVRKLHKRFFLVG